MGVEELLSWATIISCYTSYNFVTIGQNIVTNLVYFIAHSMWTTERDWCYRPYAVSLLTSTLIESHAHPSNSLKVGYGSVKNVNQSIRYTSTVTKKSQLGPLRLSCRLYTVSQNVQLFSFCVCIYKHAQAISNTC